MHKNVIKKIALFVCALVLMLPVTANAEAPSEILRYTNEETGYTVSINDRANLLTDSDENELLEVMKPLTTYGNVDFESHDTPEGEVSAFADHYSENLHGRDADATVFVIDMNTRQLYISNDGAFEKVITNARSNVIADNCYRSASAGNYYECAYIVYTQIGTLMDGGKIAAPMKLVTNTLMAFVIALLINYIVATICSRTSKAGDDEIVENIFSKEAFEHTGTKHTNTTRTYSPQSSGSSGGGGGGGGGGGHSGGGHSF